VGRAQTVAQPPHELVDRGDVVTHTVPLRDENRNEAGAPGVLAKAEIRGGPLEIPVKPLKPFPPNLRVATGVGNRGEPLKAPLIPQTHTTVQGAPADAEHPHNIPASNPSQEQPDHTQTPKILPSQTPVPRILRRVSIVLPNPPTYVVEQAGEAASAVGDVELVEDDPVAILHGGFTFCASAPGGNHPSALRRGTRIAAQPWTSQSIDLLRVMFHAGQPTHNLHQHKRSFSYRQSTHMENKKF